MTCVIIGDIVAKGEIAPNEQFLILLQRYQNSFAVDALKPIYKSERVNFK